MNTPGSKNPDQDTLAELTHQDAETSQQYFDGTACL